MKKSKFGKSLLFESRREGKHSWRNYHIKPAYDADAASEIRHKQFVMEGIMERKLKAVKHGFRVSNNNRRIA